VFVKKVIRYCIFVFLPLSLSGCLDIFQHIARMDNGKDRHTLKIGVSKAIMEMAARFGEGDANLNVLSTDTADIENEYARFNGKAEVLNTETEFGYILNMDIGYNREVVDAIIKEKPSFVPLYTKEGMSLGIESLGDNSETNEYGLVFLSTSRYRLSVSKRCMASVSRVTITKNGKETPVSFLDLGDSYFVEIPILLLMDGDTVLTLYAK
jgi:hypothetical protein